MSGLGDSQQERTDLLRGVSSARPNNILLSHVGALEGPVTVVHQHIIVGLVSATYNPTSCQVLEETGIENPDFPRVPWGVQDDQSINHLINRSYTWPMRIRPELSHELAQSAAV